MLRGFASSFCKIMIRVVAPQLEYIETVVQEQLPNPLSMKLLDGDFKPGDRIKVTADGDELKLQRK